VKFVQGGAKSFVFQISHEPLFALKWIIIPALARVLARGSLARKGTLFFSGGAQVCGLPLTVQHASD
jgi:hypothetical protein